MNFFLSFLKTIPNIFLFITASLSLCGCIKHNSNRVLETEIVDSIIPKYAKGFTVKITAQGVRLVDITDPQRAKDSGNEMTMETSSISKNLSEKSNDMRSDYHFALVKRGTNAQIPSDYTVIEVPVRSVICMTLLQISNFIALDAYDFLVGITSTKNLYNQEILSRVANKRIVKIGMEGNFDAETIISANPDVVFVSPFKRGGYEEMQKTGITLVPHLGYKELHPLGQAEWIRFTAMFLGLDDEAEDIFKDVEKHYNEIRDNVVANIKSRPTVFSGEMHGGNWYAVGSRNHLAQLFRDAGADYIIDSDGTGGVNVEFEKMYAMASDADYWRILNSFHGDFSYSALLASESRNGDFKAFKSRHIIYCNMRQTPYYETAPVRPDAVLEDFVAVFHPEIMGKEYIPRYYHLLK